MITVRDLEENDLEQLVVIENESFSLPWSKESFKEAIEDKNARYIVVLDGDVLCGYLGMWYGGDDSEITNVAIGSEHRGKGYSHHLLLEAESMAKREGIKKLFLEVRQSNEVAKSLYKGHGFEEIGIRKNFYVKPCEDGIVLKKNI